MTSPLTVDLTTLTADSDVLTADQTTYGVAPDGYITSIPLIGRTLTVDNGSGGAVPYQVDATGTYMLIGECRIVADTLDGTPGRTGATRNLVAFDRHGLDDRLFYNGREGGGTMYHANRRLAFPATLVPGDSVVFWEAGDRFNTQNGETRWAGGRYNTIICIAETVSEPSQRYAPEAVRGANPYRPRAVSPIIDFDALLNFLPDLPIPGPKISLSTFITKLSTQYPLSSFTKQDNDMGGYEHGVPLGLLLSDTHLSGYSANLGYTYMGASQHIFDKRNPLADRRTLLKHMIRHGLDYFLPQLNDINNVDSNGGGHFSAQSIPAMWALWALGETDLLQNYGTPTLAVHDNVNQFAYVTPTTLAQMVEHTNPNWPHAFRVRQVTAVTADSVSFRWTRTNSDDPYWCQFHGLILRKAGDPVTDHGRPDQSNSQNPPDAVDGERSYGGVVTIKVPGISGISVGDMIWFDTPWPLAVGSPIWAVGFTRTDISSYSPTPTPTYADYQNGSFEMNAILAVVFGLQDTPRWGPIVDYVIYKNRANFPGPASALLDMKNWKFSGSPVDANRFVAMTGFYDAHMQNLVGATRFNQTIGYS